MPPNPNSFLTVYERLECEDKEAISPVIQQHHLVCCTQQEDTASGRNGGHHRVQVSGRGVHWRWVGLKLYRLFFGVTFSVVLVAYTVYTHLIMLYLNMLSQVVSSC